VRAILFFVDAKKVRTRKRKSQKKVLHRRRQNASLILSTEPTCPILIAIQEETLDNVHRQTLQTHLSRSQYDNAAGRKLADEELKRALISMRNTAST